MCEIKNNFKANRQHTHTGNKWTIDVDSIINRINADLYDKTKIKIKIIEDHGEGSEGCEGLLEREIDDYLSNISQSQSSNNNNKKTSLETKLRELYVQVKKLEDDNNITRVESEAQQKQQQANLSSKEPSRASHPSPSDFIINNSNKDTGEGSTNSSNTGFSSSGTDDGKGAQF